MSSLRERYLDFVRQSKDAQLVEVTNPDGLEATEQTGSLDELIGLLEFMGDGLAMSAVLIGAWLIFKPKLGLKAALGCMIIGFALGRRFITVEGARFVFGVVLGVQLTDSQVVFLYGLLLIAVLGVGLAHLTVKRRRSMDRLLFTFAGASMLVTTAWFHVLFIHLNLMGMLAENERYAMSIAQAPTEVQEVICTHADIDCLTIPHGTAFSHEDEYFQTIVTNMLAGDGPKNSTFPNSNLVRGGPYAIAVTEGVGPQQGNHIVVRSQKLISGFFMMELTFLSQLAVTHSIWLFGALGLMAFHKYRFRRRAAGKEPKKKAQSTTPDTQPVAGDTTGSGIPASAVSD
ncbi:MAG: hypothetical protein Alpg2KO_30410 [Alphaproteobacteria bacterium]